MKNASTQEINALALSNDFSQLYDALNAPGGHKSQSLATIFARHPQLRTEPHDVEALYDDLLIETVAKYDEAKAASGIDFLQCLNQALKVRSLTLRAKVAGRNAVTRSIEGGVNITAADGGQRLNASLEDAPSYIDIPAALSTKSAEDEFMEREIVEDYMRTVEADPSIGPHQAAVIRHRIENGLSCNEIVNLAPGVFRNRQQMWRAERRAGLAWMNGRNGKGGANV